MIELDAHENRALSEFLSELIAERFDPEPKVDQGRIARGPEGQIIVPVLVEAESPSLSLALLMARKADYLYKHTTCRFALAQRPTKDPKGGAYVWKDEAWHALP
jgi:hypothetical protein